MLISVRKHSCNNNSLYELWKQGKVEECYRLMLVVASTAAVYFQSSNNNKRKFGTTLPGSPRGVMDMSFSYDTSSSNDSWSVAAATTTASVSSSPEPLFKKSRAPSTRLAKDWLFDIWLSSDDQIKKKNLYVSKYKPLPLPYPPCNNIYIYNVLNREGWLSFGTSFNVQ